jgi:hypothetical protein
MGEMVREEILKRVRQAGVFSIIIDTTTDISHLEQYSLVLRFINEKSQTRERLTAMKIAHDSTGLGMFNVFCDICIKYNLDWETNLCAHTLMMELHRCSDNILMFDVMSKKKSKCYLRLVFCTCFKPGCY